MPRVKAIFDEIFLESPLIATSENDVIEVSAVIEDSEVNAQIKAAKLGCRAKRPGDKHFRFGCDRISISVTREDSFELPATVVTPEGFRDNTERDKYVHLKAIPYGDAARKFVERLVSFCKFDLHQPTEWTNPRWSDQLLRGNSPRFFNEEGENLWNYRQDTIVVAPAPGIAPPFPATEPLSEDHFATLSSRLSIDREIAVWEEFLADAQLAYFADRAKRAVIELAIAAETRVKSHYFGGSPRAQAAFDSIEDGGAKGNFIEWIGRHAQRVHGKNFATEYPSHYKNIDYLFRARNKVVHRGVLRYRDNSGVEIEVTSAIVIQWWESVHALFDWLSKLP